MCGQGKKNNCTVFQCNKVTIGETEGQIHTPFYSNTVNYSMDDQN